MRVLLVALNASYVHTNLAIRYLREMLITQGDPDIKVKIREFTINERVESIAAEIFEEKPDLLGFSCYIWNISLIMMLLRRLRPVMPDTFFLGGGPELSFDSEKIMADHPEWDGIIAGEGEHALVELVQALKRNQSLADVPGLTWRQGLSCRQNQECAKLPDLNELPQPYSAQEDFQGKLVYVETSRGCPFRCQFCVSSLSKGVRYLEPERLRPVLQRLFACGASTVKFVDRTFNASKKHGFAVLDIFREEALKAQKQVQKQAQNQARNQTRNQARVQAQKAQEENKFRAHCEMAGELLDEEWLNYLKNYPQGMIQLELGVQSTHQPTLRAIGRAQNFKGWQQKAAFLQHSCGIPVHLDLIAGLPLESMQEFRRSFNEVFASRPNHLQLGFLKLLKGSGLRQKSREYGLVYSPDPPYSILKTEHLSHAEIIALQRTEDMVEKYYNSGKFAYGLAYILAEEESPFDFFHSLGAYFQEKGWFGRSWSPEGLMANLWQYLGEKTGGQIKDLWREALRFDYYLWGRPRQIPSFLETEPALPAGSKESTKDSIRNDPLWREIIPETWQLDHRQWARATAIEYFAADIPSRLPALLTGSKNSIKPAGSEGGIRPVGSEYWVSPVGPENHVSPSGLEYCVSIAGQGKGISSAGPNPGPDSGRKGVIPCGLPEELSQDLPEEAGSWYLFYYGEGKARYYKYPDKRCL